MVEVPALDLAAEFSALEQSGAAESARETGGMSVRLVRIPAGVPGRWDAHADGPETVLVVAGEFEVALRDTSLVLAPGQMCVVPAGVEHRGVSAQGAQVVLLRRLPD